MKSFRNSKSIHADILDNLALAQQGEIPPPDLPNELKHRLAQLSLLYGVPIEYLIPDIRLLPTESIRFFYVDRNWLDRLIDGAMSVGVLSSQDAVFNLSFFKQIYQQIDIEQLTLRSTLRGIEEEAPQEYGGQITGFIFRSQVVADFPGIEIKPIKDGKTLPILRMDTLSPNTLLCLFYGVPDQVDFIQPGEGLQFGLFPNDDDKKQSEGDFHVFLRGLGEGGYPAGKQIQDDSGVKLTSPGNYRSGDKQVDRVVDIGGLVTSIIGKMPENSLKDNTLTSGGFAIELTKTAQKQRYDTADQYPSCCPSPANNKSDA